MLNASIRISNVVIKCAANFSSVKEKIFIRDSADSILGVPIYAPCLSRTC